MPKTQPDLMRELSISNLITSIHGCDRVVCNCLSISHCWFQVYLVVRPVVVEIWFCQTLIHNSENDGHFLARHLAEWALLCRDQLVQIPDGLLSGTPNVVCRQFAHWLWIVWKQKWQHTSKLLHHFFRSFLERDQPVFAFERHILAKLAQRLKRRSELVSC